jgi:hypothetical protein
MQNEKWKLKNGKRKNNLSERLLDFAVEIIKLAV